MIIFMDGDRVHLQLKDLHNNKMLIDFSIEKEAFKELRDHLISHLLAFEVPK